LNFQKIVSEKFNFLENRIRKILEYEWEKINIKTTFKSILENKIRKNMNFGKRFPKTMRAKLEFQGCLKKYEGGEEKISYSLTWPLCICYMGYDIKPFKSRDFNSIL
jgi:hypothetical protein